MTLCSSGLQVLAPEGETLSPGDTATIPLNWKLRLPPGHFGLLLPLSQQAKKGVPVLVGVIDLDYQDEISLLLHNGGDMHRFKLTRGGLVMINTECQLDWRMQSVVTGCDCEDVTRRD
ncbi:putative inactive deoxyuridine 5'-triphosphate nucleotidohydrolase-like protein FLJ16323 [Symphalangus syndactylus]|uniref:putative inactive deoxyuridine 5'-triphosphate nucleotidohydrolase-like protein FLJ16323 n=1 Tax=Symphalangus syndactylus TaxID=9590 RepID=UPI003005A54D